MPRKNKMPEHVTPDIELRNKKEISESAKKAIENRREVYRRFLVRIKCPWALPISRNRAKPPQGLNAKEWRELKSEILEFENTRYRKEPDDPVLLRHPETRKRIEALWPDDPQEWDKFLPTGDVLKEIEDRDPPAYEAYEKYMTTRKGGPNDTSSDASVTSNESKTSGEKEYKYDFDSPTNDGGLYTPNTIMHNAARGQYGTARAGMPPLTSRFMKDTLGGLSPIPKMEPDSPPPKMGDLDQATQNTVFDWAEKEQNHMYLQALAFSHPDEFKEWMNENEKTNEDYPWFDETNFDDLAGAKTEDSEDLHAVFYQFKDEPTITNRLQAKYPDQYARWQAARSKKNELHGQEWPVDHDKHAKQEGDPATNTYTGDVGTKSNPMQPGAQPFQRISAAGDRPFIPKRLNGPEGQRDENDRDKTDGLVPVIQGGDSTTDNQPAEATLRPSFQLDPLATKIIPTPEKQIQSDVLFDMFSVVQPGFGKGVDNKLVYENEARENAIRFKQPMYLPRFEHGNADIGIAQHVHPVRWQFQPHGVDAELMQHMRDLNERMIKMQGLMAKATALGADPRTLPHVSNHHPSTQGLPRQQLNILRPVIDNRSRWNPVAEAPGFALNKRGLRHLHSPWMEPFHAEHDPMNSGPVLKKRRALELILP